MRPLIYSFRFSHHGRFSSYHCLTDFLKQECRTVTVPFGPSFLAGSPRFVRNWLRLNEYRILPFLAGRKNRCVHYLYPENSLFRGLKWLEQHRLFVTWHQPISYLETLSASLKRRSADILQQAYHVVFLSHQSRTEYEDRFEIKSSSVIKHGVDTDFFRFKEPSRPKDKFTIVTVGNWLRDHRCWAQTVEYLLAKRPDFCFEVLCNVESAIRYRQYLGETSGRVKFLHHIDDYQLLKFYERANAAFFPLSEATANNALLECMATGVACVISDLPSTREYAGDAALYFDNGNIQQAARHLIALASDDELRSNLARTARSEVECELSWPSVAAKHVAVYLQAGTMLNPNYCRRPASE